ncbi:MAG: SDR family NAD(P)-dependent oxidoreductase [Gammaproteobacteria bacterium]|nr:SDR family NAD(P)-dependent oxidoreductase [Gammaproteobacteria bacterium]
MLLSEGRVVLVSGANRGIGQAVAQALYEAGYTLSLGARQVDSLNAITADWDEARVLKHHYDAEDHATHAAWVGATVDRFGRLDGLVNNAGIALDIDLEDDNDAGLDRLMAINVKAPLSMIRKCMPHLRQSGSGRVINVASMAGKAVFGSGIGYSMSKFALVALSHATRHSGWDDGVRCTALCPGYVSTDMTSDVSTIDTDMMTTPRDIAELVLTVMGLSNKASVAELIVNCRNDVSM